MDTNNLKAFDLQGALAGKPVAHRDLGRNIHNFAMVGDVVAFRGSDPMVVYCCTREGKGRSGEQLLFMVPEEKEAWLNLYVSTDGPCIAEGYAWHTENDADNAKMLNRLGNKAHRITWTE